VWKPALPSLCADEKLWFKQKGPKFSRRLPPVKKTTGKVDKVVRAEEYAQAVMDEKRLEQGWEYLEGMGVPRTLQGTGVFLQWLKMDVKKEEGREMQDAGFHAVLVLAEERKIGKAWYAAKLKEGKA